MNSNTGLFNTTVTMALKEFNQLRCCANCRKFESNYMRSNYWNRDYIQCRCYRVYYARSKYNKNIEMEDNFDLTSPEHLCEDWELRERYDG